MIVVKSFVYYCRRTTFDSSVIFRRTKRIKSIEKSIFSDDWIIDRIKFLINLRKFYQHIENYQSFAKYIAFKKQLNNEILSSKTSSWKNISSILFQTIELLKLFKLFYSINLKIFSLTETQTIKSRTMTFNINNSNVHKNIFKTFHNSKHQRNVEFQHE